MKIAPPAPRNFTVATPAIDKIGTHVVDDLISVDRKSEYVYILRMHIVDTFELMDLFQILSQGNQQDALEYAVERMRRGRKPVGLKPEISRDLYLSKHIPVVTYEMEINVCEKTYELISVTRDVITNPVFLNSLDCDIGLIRKDRGYNLLRMLGDMLSGFIGEMPSKFGYTKSLLNGITNLFSDAIIEYAKKMDIDLLTHTQDVKPAASGDSLPGMKPICKRTKVSFASPLRQPSAFFNTGILLDHAGYEGAFQGMESYRDEIRKLQREFLAQDSQSVGRIPPESWMPPDERAATVRALLEQGRDYAGYSGLFAEGSFKPLRLCEELSSVLLGVNSTKIVAHREQGGKNTYVGQLIIIKNDGTLCTTEVVPIKALSEIEAKNRVAARFWGKLIDDRNLQDPSWTQQPLITDVIGHIGRPPKQAVAEVRAH